MKVIDAGPYRVLDFPPVVPGWDFWPMWSDGRWESGTKRTIDLFASGKRCVDIGAWVGPTVLWMHRAGAESIRAFEPDPVAFGVLSTNCLINDLNVDLNRHAVGVDTCGVTLQSNDFGGSETGLLPGDKITVPSVTVAEACAGAEFVKVDIEGAEYDLLPEFAAVGCPMLISVHPPYWPGDEPDWSGWSTVQPIADGGGFGEMLCIP